MKKNIFMLTLVVMSMQSVTAQDSLYTKILYKESCVGTNFSFWFDGYEQPFRLFPYFVEYDSTNWLNSYRKPIYLFEDYSLKYKKILDCDTSIQKNMVPIYVPKLKKKVNKMYKRSKINQKFNGYLYYEKYKVTFTIDRIETADVIIPYLGNGCKHRRQITEEVNCIVYRIKEIKSIEPIE